MARPKTLKGSKVLIRLGDGASPENFVAPCALTTKGINLAAASNEFNVPDCDDPDAPTFTERVVSALSAGIAGSGTLAMDSLQTWREWFLSGQSKNIEVVFDESPANGGGYFSLAAVLSTLNLGGNNGELATIETQLDSDGEITWTDAT
jgi:hypothetical protein